MEVFMSRLFSVRWGACVLFAACEMQSARPPDLESPSDSVQSFQSFARRGSIDHGDLPIGSTLNTAMSRAASLHVAHFTLERPAEIELRTQTAQGTPIADSFLSLFAEQARPRLLARGSSAVRLQLAAGRYRIEVRGLTRASYGEFQLSSVCTGDGCPAPVTACLFGEQFPDIRTNSELALSADEWITSVDQLADATERQQLVVAVRQSSHTDVATPEEALERVDQNEVRRIWIHHPATSRSFVVYEYGAGDNSYGAFFFQEQTEVVASIHDGDLLECLVTGES
jgi:hypothetical protein